MNQSAPYVLVTFRLDPDDPSHPTGLTIQRFDRIADGITDLGGYDYEITLMPAGAEA